MCELIASEPRSCWAHRSGGVLSPVGVVRTTPTGRPVDGICTPTGRPVDTVAMPCGCRPDDAHRTSCVLPKCGPQIRRQYFQWVPHVQRTRSARKVQQTIRTTKYPLFILLKTHPNSRSVYHHNDKATKEKLNFTGFCVGRTVARTCFSRGTVVLSAQVV